MLILQGASWTNQQTATITQQMRKALRETQTLRAGCSKAEPKIFAMPQTPFPGAWDGQNLISWRWSLPLPKNPVWWGSMQVISSYRGNRPTHTHKHMPPVHCKHAHRQDREQYIAPLSLACSVTQEKRLVKQKLITTNCREHWSNFLNMQFSVC